MIDTMEDGGDNNLVITLKEPSPMFLSTLAMFSSGIMEKSYCEEVGEEGIAECPVGTGPFILSEWDKGEKMVFTANPYYWEEGCPKVDEVDIVVVADDTTRIMQLESGQIDMASDIPYSRIDELKAAGNLTVNLFDSTDVKFVIINCQNEYLKDKKVRQALELATDKDAINAAVYFGYGELAPTFLSPAAPHHNKNLTPVAHDAEAAKALLAEAGYPNGEGFPAFDYLTNDADYHKAVAEYLQSAWAELGLTMNVNIQEWKTVTADRRSGNFDVARNGWVYDWDDPSNMINLLETTNGNNDGKYSSAEFDKLIDDARNTTDINEHYDLLHQAEQVLLKDAAMAPIAYYNEFWLQKPNLKGTWHSPYGYWYFMYGSLE